MSVQISKEVLEFVNIAADKFNKDDKLYTYRSDEYIALRTGMFEDCIQVFDIGSDRGNFVQWCNRPKDDKR